MSTLLDVTLTPDQYNLLSTIARSWLDRGDWPVWGSIQRHFDERYVDADAVFHSLPRVGPDVPYAAGYGFTVPMRAPIDPNDRVRLTVASALILPEMRMMAGEPFVKVLNHMIDLYLRSPVLPDQAPRTMMRSHELAADFGSLKPWFIKVLPDLLSYEPAISTSGADFGGTWEREVTRSIMQFRNIHTVEAYVAKTCEIVAATAAQFTTAPTEEEQMPAAEPARGPYIDDALIADLETASSATTWNLDRLIALCRELNHNYTAEMAHASAAMIRTILDHIPPVFGGHRDFKTVAAQHPFGKTDKAYAQELVRFKDVAHDALHRQIGQASSTLVMEDLPAPVRLRAMLREMLTLL